MSLSKYGLLLGLLIIMVAVSLFGGHFGYSVGGVPQGGMSSEAPGVFGVVEWVWDSIQFMFCLASFQIDDMPEVISSVFLIMSVMVVFIVVNLVRGS